MEQYVTINNLCIILGIKKNTAYKLSSKKVLPKYKPSGKIVLFKRSDIIAYIERKRIASRQEAIDVLKAKLFKN